MLFMVVFENVEEIIFYKNIMSVLRLARLNNTKCIVLEFTKNHKTGAFAMFVL